MHEGLRVKYPLFRRMVIKILIFARGYVAQLSNLKNFKIVPSFVGLINADRWADGQTDESNISRGQLNCDGTREETKFRLSAKGTSPFKSAGGRQPRCAHQR